MSKVYYYNTKLEWLILDKREKTEFDKNKEYIQQVARDKGKGKWGLQTKSWEKY